MSAEFTGFPKEGIKFLNDLRKNNTRDWFNKNKAIYDDQLVAPAKSFVVAMGEKLKSLSPNVIAEPAVNKSLFRLNRDTRFSPDKTPYKTQFSIFFWEGDGKRMENPGYYLCFDGQKLTIAAGAHEFSREKLDAYREAVIGEKSGAQLDEVLKKLKRKGIEPGGAHYKRVPRDYDANHPRAELLKHNGLYLMTETKLPAELHRKQFVTYCMKEFRKMDPLQRWLASNL